MTAGEFWTMTQPDRRIGGVFTAELGEPVKVDLEGMLPVGLDARDAPSPRPAPSPGDVAGAMNVAAAGEVAFRRPMAGTHDFAFNAAGAALVVAGDTRTAQTNGPLVSTVGAPRQHPVMTTARADAVGAHRGVKATVAQPITGPPNTEFVGAAAAASASLGAVGDSGASPHP